MLASQIPAKFPEVWAKNADPSNIRTIPTTTTTPGAASLDIGFPPLNFAQPAAGGIPPFGQDFNGIMNQVVAWLQWQNAGGLTVFDATFAAAVGGYPKGAVIAGTAASGALWLNLTDSNSNNPDTFGPGSGWVGVVIATDIQSQKWNWAGTFAGSANALQATLNPAPAALTAGLTVWGIVAADNTSPTVTLNLNGLGAKSIITGNPSQLSKGMLAVGIIVVLTYDGTQWQFVNTRPVFIGDSGAGGVAGLVPGPAAGDGAAGRMLTALGTWAQVATGNIANLAVTAAKMALATITNAQIAAATILGANIAAATITGSNLVNATITNVQIAAATILGSNIAAGTVAASNLASTTGAGSTVALADSPAFVNNPTAPTQATGDSSTKLATTALVDAKIAANVYAGSSTGNTAFPIGTTILIGGSFNRNANTTVGLSADVRVFDAASSGVAGTWAARGFAQPGGGNVTSFQRIL